MPRGVPLSGTRVKKANGEKNTHPKINVAPCPDCPHSRDLHDKEGCSVCRAQGLIPLCLRDHEGFLPSTRKDEVFPTNNEEDQRFVDSEENVSSPTPAVEEGLPIIDPKGEGSVEIPRPKSDRVLALKSDRPSPSPERPIDALNYWGVLPSKDRDGIGIQFRRYPVPRTLSREEALVFAAWIVRVADPTGHDFSRFFLEVKKQPEFK